jgi:acyl-CoA synthetase (AMP-forming)/AMP-acid ligase II
MITHGNLASNISSIGSAVDVNEGDVVLTWLPLFHDMGLIGSLLFATYFGLPCVLMTPTSFLMHPEAWLWAISRFRVSCCAAPNVAYHICGTQIPDVKLCGLDLSTWRAALTGSELVQPQTVAAFCDKFEAYGFESKAMVPVYGLAENTVAVCIPRRGSPPKVDWIDRRILEAELRAAPLTEVDRTAPAARGVVSVGNPTAGQEVRVVDDRGSVVSERTVGGIEVRGSSVMAGYFSDSRASSAAVSDSWLRTGDTGYLFGGELYVVGRTKEVIVRGGRKYDAADIAAAVAEIPGIRAGAVAAFGITSSATGTEDVVIMAETLVPTAGDRTLLEATVAACVQRLFALPLARIVLLGPGKIPRTTSGKVQHNLARSRYLDSVGSS